MPETTGMSAVFDKLNLKTATEIVVLDAPASFEPQLAGLAGVRILREPSPGRAVHFAIAFVTTQIGLDQASRRLVDAAEGDPILWFAYPKQRSKTYRSEIHRDHGWDVIRAAGYDSVRMVAIDDDWSALRFRKTGFIRA
jgi:hypothetical protein